MTSDIPIIEYNGLTPQLLLSFYKHVFIVNSYGTHSCIDYIHELDELVGKHSLLRISKEYILLVNSKARLIILL